MTTLADLRRAAEALPPGSAVTLPREALLEAITAADGATADLTVAEVAQRFGRSASTVRAWLAQGLLRGYRLRGREWRIPRAAVEEFEAAEREGRGENGARPGRTAPALSSWRNAAP